MQPVWIVSRTLHYRRQGLSVSSLSLYPKDILRVTCQTMKTCGLPQS